MEPREVSSISRGTLVYYFLQSKESAFVSDGLERKMMRNERSNPRVTTKLTGDFAIFYNIRWSQAFLSLLKASLAGKAGGILNEPISCWLI